MKHEAIVAGMDAATVHLNMKMFHLHDVNCCCKKKRNMKKRHPKKQQTKASTAVKAYHFFTDVYDIVRQIPKGRVSTYGAIAAYLGTKLSARMVGWAMNASHVAVPPVPAQRVVNRNGMLTGKHHFETPTKMQELLEKEGLKITNDTIENFERHFWDPSTELSL
jgi:methylated-DNA-protein-cysteine methyltransferase-like protein